MKLNAEIIHNYILIRVYASTNQQIISTHLKQNNLLEQEHDNPLDQLLGLLKIEVLKQDNG